MPRLPDTDCHVSAFDIATAENRALCSNPCSGRSGRSGGWRHWRIRMRQRLRLFRICSHDPARSEALDSQLHRTIRRAYTNSLRRNTRRSRGRLLIPYEVDYPNCPRTDFVDGFEGASDHKPRGGYCELRATRCAGSLSDHLRLRTLTKYCSSVGLPASSKSRWDVCNDELGAVPPPLRQPYAD